VGFQVTLFIWRIDREVEKKPEQYSWLPPSDWLGGLSMLCFVVGGLLLPIVGAVDIQTAKNFFGLGALLFKGRPSRSMMSGFGANDLCPRNKTNRMF
jgi:hypothetical protein